MSEASQQAPKTLPANLEALQRELDELFRRVKPSGQQEPSRKIEGPVLIIRGK